MIDKDKQYRTKNGREVRIYATDAGGFFPVHGAVWVDGVWSVKIWTKFGSCDADFSDLDLVEVTPATTGEGLND